MTAIDEPRRVVRAAADEAFRGTPFRRDLRKLVWTARYDAITVGMWFDRSLYGPVFSAIVGAHVDGIVQPTAFDARDISTYVLYARLWLLDKTFDEKLLDFDKSPPAERRVAVIADALKMHALPILTRCSTLEGMRSIALEQPEGSGLRPAPALVSRRRPTPGVDAVESTQAERTQH